MPRCPVCKIQCAPTKYENVPVSQCGQCGGYWVSKIKLDRICALRDIQMPEPVRQKMMDIADAHNSTKTLYCLTCGTEMLKEQFKYWDDIQVDFCPKCEGLWLDCGELEKCQIYWEYLEDNRDNWAGREAAERKALLLAKLESRKAELAMERETARERAYQTRRIGMPGLLWGLFGR